MQVELNERIPTKNVAIHYSRRRDRNDRRCTKMRTTADRSHFLSVTCFLSFVILTTFSEFRSSTTTCYAYTIPKNGSIRSSTTDTRRARSSSSIFMTTTNRDIQRSFARELQQSVSWSGADDDGTAVPPRPETLRDAIKKNNGRIPYGEESRKYRRNVYTHEDWVKHRSESRIIKHLKGIYRSGILRQLSKEIALVVSVAGFVVLWNDAVAPTFDLPNLCLPVMPFTLSSPALGLLLVFRTNASYGRWLEARTKWGLIINHCNNLVRMASTYVDKTDDQQRLALNRLCRAAWAVPRSLTNRLAGPDEDDKLFEAEIRDAYSRDDPTDFVSYVLAAQSRPSAALLELTMALDEIEIDTARRIEIDKSIVILNDCAGACERIFTSPVPLVYTRHTARFLGVWLMLLPFALYGSFVEDASGSVITFAESGAFVFALSFVSLFLFGIEELAVTLEEPFSILPMKHFCDKIKKSTEAMQERALSIADYESDQQRQRQQRQQQLLLQQQKIDDHHQS